MHAAHTFDTIWRTHLDGQGPELLPGSLAKAVAETLGVDGAGICLFGHLLRIPLGASSGDAAVAEQAQTTSGTGPCLEAITYNVMISASAGTLSRRWPALADGYAATRYRSTLSLPAKMTDGLNVAVDLYFDSPTPAEGLDLTEAAVVARLVRTSLLHSMTTERNGETPAILTTHLARQRALVWGAIGIVMATMNIEETEALARLRAHAYASEQSLDDLADDLLARRIPAEEIADN